MEDVEWDYIGGWEETGIITESMLEKWAYAENGYFTEQDEDLLFYRPELIQTMYQLMLDEKSNRKVDLLKTLKGYSTQIFNKNIDEIAQIKFKNLKLNTSTSELHHELIRHLNELSE